MTQFPDSNAAFGLTIAYLIPGFVSLIALGQYSPATHAWLISQPGPAPTVGGFLYTTLASLTLGLTLSTIRWLLLDRLHHATGVARPAWDFSTLQHHVDAFQLAVDYHYRYYQFYSNTLMVLVVWAFLPHPLSGLLPGSTPVHRLLLAALALLFFLASRDALRNYFGRAVAVCGNSSVDKESTHDQRIEAAPTAGAHSQKAADH